MLDEPFLSDWRKNKNPEEVRKGFYVLKDTYNGTFSGNRRALFQRKRHEKPKKVIEEMETITDQYNEAVDRPTSH